MDSEKFNFENRLNYSISHISNPTLKTESFFVPHPCILLCTSGSAKINYNMETYTITKDSIFCLFANTTLKGLEISEDFQGIGILFSTDAIIDTTIGFKAEYLASIFAQPYKPISDTHNAHIISDLFNSLDTYHKLEEKYDRSTDFVYSIIRCLIIAIAEISKHTPECGVPSSFSTTDNYFREFLKLLSTHCKTQHNVSFYADKLCITPKYLNEICRKKTKRTAKEVISRSVIAQIKSALIVSGTSVQRIAYDFNFCDQSSFGKYFKKAVGMAPLAFRNKHNGDTTITYED